MAEWVASEESASLLPLQGWAHGCHRDVWALSSVLLGVHNKLTIMVTVNGKWTHTLSHMLFGKW